MWLSELLGEFFLKSGMRGLPASLTVPFWGENQVTIHFSYSRLGLASPEIIKHQRKEKEVWSKWRGKPKFCEILLDSLGLDSLKPRAAGQCTSAQRQDMSFVWSSICCCPIQLYFTYWCVHACSRVCLCVHAWSCVCWYMHVRVYLWIPRFNLVCCSTSFTHLFFSLDRIFHWPGTCLLG